MKKDKKKRLVSIMLNANIEKLTEKVNELINNRAYFDLSKESRLKQSDLVVSEVVDIQDIEIVIKMFKAETILYSNNLKKSELDAITSTNDYEIMIYNLN